MKVINITNNSTYYMARTDFKNLFGRIIFKFYPKDKRYTTLYHWIMGVSYFIPVCCIKQWVGEHNMGKIQLLKEEDKLN